MTRWNSSENLAERDAYFDQLLARFGPEHRPGFGNHRTVKEYEACPWCSPKSAPVPKESGDPVDGALNANLHPAMLPFEHFVRDLSHKQHPYCD